MKHTKFVQDDRRRVENERREREEDARFNAWLLTQGGARVTGVRGDPTWNQAVATAAAVHIIRNT